MTDDEHGIPYTTGELFDLGPQRTFEGQALSEIAFPLGGIGTGCISLGGRGQLRDWEIFGRPNQGFRPSFTFATLRARTADGEPVVRVVEAPALPPFSGCHGTERGDGEGFPHMDSAEFRGEYPFAWIEFEDAKMPLQVDLEAFNPFIPLNDDDSGLPVAILTYRLTNPTDQPVEGLLTWTMQNVLGYEGAAHLSRADLGGNRNTFRSEDGLQGFLMSTERYPEDSPRFGTLALCTTWPDVTYSADLGPAGAFATGHLFWDYVSRRSRFDDEDQADPTPEGESTTCALGMEASLDPGQSAEVTVLLTWHFPNFVFSKESPTGEKPRWRDYPTRNYDDAWDVAAGVAGDLDRLRSQTQQYHDALFGSTLPAHVLDAAGSQTSTLKSCTCLRLEDGTFYAFEGCSSTSGCCYGSCTHVWNYQQALPFLFPALERSMREADYRYNLRDEDGRMCFRIEVPLGNSHWDFHAAADGQLGGVIKTYRDWLICGDDEWLKELWPRVKKALSYAWVEWDADEDGVAEGVQHNTYDIELHGPNPLIGAFYMGALRAAEEMARYLGEDEEADRYNELFHKGSAWMDQNLFNGEYYVQEYDPDQAPTNQFGDGCPADQMLGQWIASICRLGYLFEAENVRSALRSVFRYNWLPDLEEHANPQRIYALNDEAGLLMCTWPRGNRPLVPTRYCDEVWTGIEYQVASHLAMEGMIEEALCIVKGTRERHDGRRRNPWDEPECGSHYARAMSSWGLILALSGYFYDGRKALMQFDPRMEQRDFRVFWSTGSGWGTFGQRFGVRSADITLEVLWGEQALNTLRLRLPERLPQARAQLGGDPVNVTSDREGQWTLLHFEDLHIEAGQKLQISLGERE